MLIPTLLFVACAHRGAPKAAVDAEQPPILAAPEADLYAAEGGQPRDPLVARAAEGLPWVEALSGAAGSLALAADRSPELGQARWAAWRAGYPYPLRSISFAAMPAGESPDELISVLRGSLKPGDQLGLARARVGPQDRWVALIGRASRTVSPFPRQIARAEPLTLQGQGLSRYRLTSPTGKAQTGELPAAPTLEETGEWWLELYADDGRVVVAAPVTVGMPASPAPPIDLPGTAPADAADAMEEALAAVGEVRAIFDLAGVGHDQTLDLLARGPLESASPWDDVGARERVRAAGFVDGAGLSCAAATVPLCLDAALRTGAGRAALLDPAWRLVGGGAKVETTGVTLVLFLGAE